MLNLVYNLKKCRRYSTVFCFIMASVVLEENKLEKIKFFLIENKSFSRFTFRVSKYLILKSRYRQNWAKIFFFNFSLSFGSIFVIWTSNFEALKFRWKTFLSKILSKIREHFKNYKNSRNFQNFFKKANFRQHFFQPRILTEIK